MAPRHENHTFSSDLITHGATRRVGCDKLRKPIPQIRSRLKKIFTLLFFFFIHIRQFHPLFAIYPSQIYHNTSSISNGMCCIRSFKIGVPVYLVLMVSEDGHIGTCSISPSPLLSHFWAPSPNLTP